MNAYARKIDALLSPAQRRAFKKYSSPKLVQSFLDTFPINFSTAGESINSPVQVLKLKKAHCMEGAVLAASLLAYHGRPPLLMDFQTTQNDEDHVVALFKEHGHWGAISKTNHPVLRWRDPIYASVRELAMSYFHEYYLLNGKKTLRAYSRPFDLRRYPPERWFAAENLDWLAEVLDDSPHSPILSKKQLSHLRPASRIEVKAFKLVEWQKKKK